MVRLTQEQRETMFIISRINFQQLGQQPGVILPRSSSLNLREQRDSHASSSCDGGFRFTFNDNDLVLDAPKWQKVRNLTPIIMNKNVSPFAQMIDCSNQYWSSKKTQLERQSNQVNITNLVRKNRLICTRREYEACIKIANAFKAFKLRKAIQNKITKKRFMTMYKKPSKKAFPRSASTGKTGGNRGDESSTSKTKKKYDNFKDDQLKSPRSNAS